MIYGKRIRLRADERSDLPKFTEWLNDPEVRRYLSMRLPVSLASEEGWFESMLKRPPEEQPLAIEIKDGDSWRLIGNCGFFEIDHTARSSEVGLFIGDKTCWNKGYGTEVMSLLLDHGFGTLNLNRIFLRVDAANKGGIRAYEKAGYVHEGVFRQGTFQDGEYRDMLFMSVLRSEWTSKKAEE
ncbi:MAG: GNAT family N-acetyltransferase [Anaerolineales bacterium]|nr:GNAT family N-acetyltransferase [Anaerolineales bacterium]